MLRVFVDRADDDRRAISLEQRHDILKPLFAVFEVDRVNDTFDFEDSETESLVEEWSGRDIQVIREGRSANYLISTGQSHDLEFILHHIEDLNIVPIAAPAGKIEDATAKTAATRN